MKLSVCGKGGSGKSTVTTLIAKELARQGKRVLIADCDESNYGLHQQLGMDLPQDFTNYFGGKFKVMELLENGPQNMPPIFDRPWTIDDIPAEYKTEKDGIVLMSPGKIQTANEACACPFNAVMCQFSTVLQLADDDVFLMDMEAGIEHFGRGTDNMADAILMIVDPSYESLKLSAKIGEIGKALGKPVYYVLNKVTEKSEAAMKAKIAEPENIVAVIPAKDDLLEQGLLGEELTGSYDEIRNAVAKIFG